MSDFPLDTPQQPLNWEQRQTGYDDGKTDDAGLTINPAFSFPWPDDPDERIWAPVYMSLNEYVALLSAVDVGAAIAWTNDALLVYYILVRNYSGGAMEFCARVAACFADDPEFRASVIESLLSDESVVNSIVDALKTSDEFNTYITERVSSLTIEAVTGAVFGGDCDNSVVAGRVLQILDTMDGNNQDFFEILEVGTNDEERVAAMLDAIPVLGESPVDNILDMAQGLLEDIWENYNAAITPEWKSEVGKLLWCLALEKEDCALTYQDLFDFFSTRAGSTLTIGSLISNVFSYIVNGDFSTDELVASGMYTIQLAFILAGQEFNGMTLPSISAISRDSSPSSAWEDWGPCSPVTPNITFIGTPSVQDGFFDGEPKTFIENTETGGSVWDVAYKTGFGATAIAVTMSECVRVIENTEHVSYQHFLCGGESFEAGTTENPATCFGLKMGWFGSGEIVTRITFEPC